MVTVGNGYALVAKHALRGSSPDFIAKQVGSFGSSTDDIAGSQAVQSQPSGISPSASHLHFKPSRSMADMHKTASLASFGGDEMRAAQYERKNQKQLDEAR